MPAYSFPKLLCSGSCANIKAVPILASFAALAADFSNVTCADAEPPELAAIPFEPGGELEIVRVRACLLFKTINPAIGVNLADPSTGIRKITSTMIFRNEPYEKNKK